MKIRSQIAFIAVTMALIFTIVWLGIYTNGMKRLRKLEKNVQATWGDVEWRLEERNEFLPVLFEVAKPYLPDQEDFYKEVLKKKESLTVLVRRGEAQDVIHKANELDKIISEFLAAIKKIPELKADESFHAKRRRLSDIEERVVSARNQYNEAVTKFNRFLAGFPGRFLGLKDSPKTFFQTSSQESPPAL